MGDRPVVWQLDHPGGVVGAKAAVGADDRHRLVDDPDRVEDAVGSADESACNAEQEPEQADQPRPQTDCTCS